MTVQAISSQNQAISSSDKPTQTPPSKFSFLKRLGCCFAPAAKVSRNTSGQMPDARSPSVFDGLSSAITNPAHSQARAPLSSRYDNHVYSPHSSDVPSPHARVFEELKTSSTVELEAQDSQVIEQRVLMEMSRTQSSRSVMPNPVGSTWSDARSSSLLPVMTPPIESSSFYDWQPKNASCEFGFQHHGASSSSQSSLSPRSARVPYRDLAQMFIT